MGLLLYTLSPIKHQPLEVQVWQSGGPAWVKISCVSQDRKSLGTRCPKVPCLKDTSRDFC